MKWIVLALAMLFAPAAWAQMPPGASAGFNKFGFNDDVGTTEESVWEGSDFSGADRCPSDTSAFTLYASSDDASDTQTVTIEGVDSNWDALSADITLTGQTVVQVGDASQWLRVNRAYNTGSTDFAGTIYLHVDSVPTSGVPDTPATDIKAVMNAGENQTLQSCYTIPDNAQVLVGGWCVSNLAAAAGGGNIEARFRAVGAGAVPRVQGLVSVDNPANWCVVYPEPITYTARTLLEVTAKRISGGSSNVSARIFGIIEKAQ